MQELADAQTFLAAFGPAEFDALSGGGRVLVALLAGCAGALLAAFALTGARGLRARAALRAGLPAALAAAASPASLVSPRAGAFAPERGEEAALTFRIDEGRAVARSRASRAFLGGERRALADFAARLTPVEGIADLAVALRALEADGRPFRGLADDAEGRSWEVSGRPAAGEAQVTLLPAGAARREIARLSGMLAMLADDRDQAAEALEVAPLLAWRRSPSGRVIWGNALYRRMTGAADAFGSDAAPLPELHHDGAGGRGVREASARLDGRRAVFDARTGERRWFEMREISSADGGLLGYGADAAPAVHAEGALRRFVETLTETFAHLSIGLAIFDRETRLGLFNPAFADLMHLDPAWLAGRPSLPDVLERLRASRRMPDHEDFRTWRAGMLELFGADGAQERPERTEVWHLPGEEQIRVVARPHPQGAVAFLFEDVSEAARLERRFATETEIRRAVMDRLEEGVAAFGPDGAARFVNPAFAAIWGTSPPGSEDASAAIFAAAEGASAETLRLPQAMAMFRARSPSSPAWDRLAAFFAAPTERAAWSEEASLIDGRRLRVRVAALPDGSILVAFTDVTDAARAESAMRERQSALEAADEIRGALLEQASSRVRTPLARILGLGQALRDAVEDGAETEQALARIDAILEAAAEVQSALSGVADLASAQAGVLSMSSETVNLRTALVSALEMAQRRAAERGVTLALETRRAAADPPEPGDAAEDAATAAEHVIGDAARVRQLMFNLATDAVHRAEPGDMVRAGARRRGETVEIWTDGPAASPDAEQEDELLRGGLAHALVRRFSELHGGTVRVERRESDGAVRRQVVCTLPVDALRVASKRPSAVA
ncbi:PAS-domain containing protein [Albimonas sp. CAU 1670]|uniref:sensor histidine kinase n=1 Tax=Albimonas sp. CAU 1670 TaxID=3032599 RepID=UPI0023D9FAEF|nr:PAS domain-containing sensor histidine kinase [Albimonas sp. CAU 1670]MDF2232493.1 PAS-domain containing protein [Albimonas sp. CAU 1670]